MRRMDPSSEWKGTYKGSCTCVDIFPTFSHVPFPFSSFISLFLPLTILKQNLFTIFLSMQLKIPLLMITSLPSNSIIKRRKKSELTVNVGVGGGIRSQASPPNTGGERCWVVLKRESVTDDSWHGHFLCDWYVRTDLEKGRDWREKRRGWHHHPSYTLTVMYWLLFSPTIYLQLYLFICTYIQYGISWLGHDMA